MKNFMKYFEGAAYFYAATLLILVLDYLARVAGYQFGYNFAPEVGLDLEMLFLLVATIAYYGAFLIIQYGLSRLNSQILDPQYLLPASFAAGITVAFTLIRELDFLFWIVYRKDMGTIFASVLVIEILFLLINFAIVWRVTRVSRLSSLQVRALIYILIALLGLIIFGLPVVV